MKPHLSRRALAALPFLPAGAAAQRSAGPLRLGLAAAPSSIDPHFQNNAPNNALASYLFDTLVVNDPESRSVPGLAASWRLLAEDRWEFTLRPGLRFADGSACTAADVIAAVTRAREVAGAAPFRIYARSVRNMGEPAPDRLLVETTGPDPLLLNSLSRIRVPSARFAGATTSEFNSGAAALGTGPYVLREYIPNNLVRLTRNPAFQGTQPPWEEAVLRSIPDDGARLAALLAGDLDVIEALPAQGAQRLAGDARFTTLRGVSGRLIYLALDHHSESSPFMQTPDGRPLPRNPLKDQRVRQALSLAINRQAMVERVMEGDAVAASQFLPAGEFGTSPEIGVTPHDPARARALLAEAGYPQGFRMVLHGTNDRYVNDARIVQALAQMFVRIGIETRAEVMPWSVFAARAPRGEFAVSVAGWGVNTGETSNPLKAICATQDRAGGFGLVNPGRYSNPALDRLLAQALNTMDDPARGALLAEASAIAFRDVAVVPLHHEAAVWGLRRGLRMVARRDGYTLAADILPG